MSEKPKNEKLCPETRQACLGAKCAVWVRIVSPLQMTDGAKLHYVDPEFYLFYEGCGKVQAVPWTKKKKESKGGNS